MQGRVLVVAGSDSGGGAGIQADLKTITALNGFAMTAVTALTAQNSLSVANIHKPPPEFVAEQIRVTLEDLGCDAVKTGMMADAPIIEAAADALKEMASGVPWVIDPVMVSTGRDRLLDEDAVQSLKTRLVALARVVTPNMAEAEILTELPVTTPQDMAAAGKAILDLGAGAALVTGGHLDGDTLTDVLVVPGGVEYFEGPRIETPHTHGTGCTLASAIACGLAQGLSLGEAVARSRDYVSEAIRSAPGYGAGHGPVNHSHMMRPHQENEGARQTLPGDVGDLTSTDGLRKFGFLGYCTFAKLKADQCSTVPDLPGVYLVLSEVEAKPRFLEKGTGGRFKDKDPNVSVADLKEKWVSNGVVLYVGKASGGSTATLRSRIKQFIQFGSGKPVGHYGGRYIWQIEGAEKLQVCWKPTPDQDPRAVEKALLASFETACGRLPFANLQG